MKILFAMQYPGHLRYYDATLRLLAERGHTIYLAYDSPDKQTEGAEALDPADDRIVVLGGIPWPKDQWWRTARGLRGAIDYTLYLHPRFAEVRYHRQRMERYIPTAFARLKQIRTLPVPRLRTLVRSMLVLEEAIPSSPKMEAFIRSVDPDAVVASPLVLPNSLQTDLVKSARALGIPTAAAIASWDNLTTKGLMKVQPDLVIVWNEAQREEAGELHRVPAARVAVTGAQPYDRWFERQPSTTRTQFHRKVGLQSDRPFLLFVGSTPSISEPRAELQFVRKWLRAIRESDEPAIRDLGVLIRPHPYNPGQWADADLAELGDVTVYPRHGANPVNEDDRADYFDSMYHSVAVVGINTSAMIEAAIVGRPVHTILADEFADTQGGTVHFHYLVPEGGGFVRVARDLEDHVHKLAETITRPEVVQGEIARFLGSFVRPHGLDRPCTPIVADAIERLGRIGRAGRRELPATLYPVRLGLRAALVGRGVAMAGAHPKETVRTMLKPAIKRVARPVAGTVHRLVHPGHARERKLIMKLFDTVRSSEEHQGQTLAAQMQALGEHSAALDRQGRVLASQMQILADQVGTLSQQALALSHQNQALTSMQQAVHRLERRLERQALANGPANGHEQAPLEARVEEAVAAATAGAATPDAVGERGTRPIHPALKRYLAEVRALAGEYSPNLFWEKQLTKLRTSPDYQRLAPDGADDLEQVVNKLGYAFKDLPPGTTDPTAEWSYVTAKVLLEDVRLKLGDISHQQLGVKAATWEHMAGLYFLFTQQMLDGYEAFIRPLGIQSEQTVARHYYYLRQIERLVDQHLGTRPLDIFEIGAGAGNLAYFLHLVGLVRNYCIVDLPEMLLNSAYTIQKYVPEADIAFNEAPRLDQAAAGPRFWFFAPQYVDRLPAGSFDLSLNFNSLMEMDEEIRDGYIRDVYRVGKAGSLFFNVNRRQRALPQRDGGSFDNNPLLYPYRSDDRVVLWEDDAFQTATRGTLGAVPSLAVARAAIINPA